MIDQTTDNRPPAPDVTALLRKHGLRPTRQRLVLGELLFSNGHRHVSAEQLHQEALAADAQVSLATVYNTLRQFTDSGVLREVHVDGSSSFFDTNTSTHDHFFVVGEERVIDVPGGTTLVERVPEAPQGYEVVGVDVVVRLRRAGT